MNQLQMLMLLLLIFLLIIITVLCSNLKKIAVRTGNDDKKDVKIMLSLKYLSNFWSPLEMSLINCEINLIFSYFSIIDASIANQVPTFELTHRKLYVSVVTLSTRDNAKLVQKLKSGLKRTFNCNKY